MESKGRISGDNFFKKLGNGRNQCSQTNMLPNSLSVSSSSFYNSNNKTETYGTLIQILKSDILQVQDMINSNTSDIKMFKILIKSPGLTKKLTDIENSKDIQVDIDKINEYSNNVEKISRLYGTNNANELVKKIFLELEYNELLLKKLSDYFILMKLKIFRDQTYQETLSKLLPIKEFMENQIGSKGNSNNNTNKISSNNNDNNYKKEYDEYKSFLNIKSYEDIINYESIKEGETNSLNNNNKHNNNLINHCKKLINQYNNKMLEELKLKLKCIKLNNEDKIKDIKDINQTFEYLMDNVKELISKNEDIISSAKLNELNSLENDKKINEEINIMKENWKKELEEYKKKLDNILLDNINLKKKNDELIGQNENLNKEINEKEHVHKEEIDKLNKEINEKEHVHKEEIDKLNKEINEKEHVHKEEIDKSNKEINTKEHDHKEEIDKLNKEIQSLKEKIENLINENNKLKSNSNNNNKENNNSNNNANNNLTSSNFPSIYEDEFLKLQKNYLEILNGDYKSITIELNTLKQKYEILTEERDTLKEKFNKMFDSKFNEDSYEKVLLDQFECMKSSFEEKLEEVNEELESLKTDTRAQIYQLKNELKEANHLKDVFLKKIINLENELENKNNK